MSKTAGINGSPIGGAARERFTERRAAFGAAVRGALSSTSGRELERRAKNLLEAAKTGATAARQFVESPEGHTAINTIVTEGKGVTQGTVEVLAAKLMDGLEEMPNKDFLGKVTGRKIASFLFSGRPTEAPPQGDPKA